MLTSGQRCLTHFAQQVGETILYSYDGLLVGYLETDDFSKACAAIKEHPVNNRWQAEMSPFFESIGNDAPDDRIFPLDEVFHLD